MPTRSKAKAAAKPKSRVSEEDVTITAVDVQYNPDIITGLLQDLNIDVESKCLQIQKELDFMATSVQQAFHLELIKLPTQVKQMPLSKFQKDFGDSLEAVTKGAIAGASRPPTSSAVPMSAAKNMRSGRSNHVFQTPSNPHKSASLLNGPSTVMRAPKEGEAIMSKNGSPLGEFVTAVKAPRNKPGLAATAAAAAVPPTPGYLQLQSGDVVALEEVDTLPEGLREDALSKMQAMMSSMQSMMNKIQAKPKL